MVQYSILISFLVSALSLSRIWQHKIKFENTVGLLTFEDIEFGDYGKIALSMQNVL